MSKQHQNPRGWNDVADWYDGWVGKGGSDHHRQLALPALLEVLDLRPGISVLDVGAGSGVLAPAVLEAEAHYTGIDVSPKLIAKARRYHGKQARFLVGDARHLAKQVGDTRFDRCVFLLSIQDMDPLYDVIRSAADVLAEGGSLAILMTHPCFRIPRQSGWGFEEQRKIQYRRIDRYLTPLKIPMKQHSQGATQSFHRPLSAYVNTLADCGLLVDRLNEITTYQEGKTRAEKRANEEFPLFVALRALKR